ncbi:MAG TPA: acetyl/propionyl/methylcrotonyl-CoA carboxylase subunit alpha [Burkholderiales bacterium]|nr:acetyl/propionyl/methylcrotonyl-CoA carboxylase subunit alpha [Burkholderiales bacterium]
MFDKILIANRGEIACRIARTARRLGVGTVAVYSHADAHAMHVSACDEAWMIGPAHPRDSYLRGDRILDVATRSGAKAIHPGYGFLSENAAFARACQQAGIVFIGPTPEAIAAMGSKSAAKALMEKAGVPLVPGYHGPAQGLATLQEEAARIGYPVLIKASAGGGGKGMRAVKHPSEFAQALAAAKREAASSFGDDAVLIEKYLQRPRHIEMQVFADLHATCLHLFERDCSVQRRHQKILEEAPAPGMTEERRRQMGAAAVAAAKAVNYVGAGTVEFIAEPDGRFYFMEMNTRLQVEHPVTEMITGLDLVEWQLRVAAGEALPLRQEQLSIDGHAIEARIYAEDAARDFIPVAGRIDHLRLPPPSAHVRVDSGIQEGDEIGVYYDPLLAKLIAWDLDRPSALRRLRAALAQYQVTGVVTNISLLSAITAHSAFAHADRDPGALHTALIESNRLALFPEHAPVPDTILAIAVLSETLHMDSEAAAAAAHSPDPYSPWHLRHGWRLNQGNHHAFVFVDAGERKEIVAHYREGGYLLDLPGGRRLSASATPADDQSLNVELDGRRSPARVVRRAGDITVFCDGRSYLLAFEKAAVIEEEDPSGRLVSPLPGSVIRVLVSSGETVVKGQALMIIEAMKMEHTVTAPRRGTVKQIYFGEGQQVVEGVQLLEFEPEQVSKS